MASLRWPVGSTNQIRPGAGWRGKHPSDLVHGGVAKLVSHLVLIQKITGSSPVAPSISFRSKGPGLLRSLVDRQLFATQ